MVCISFNLTRGQEFDKSLKKAIPLKLLSKKFPTHCDSIPIDELVFAVTCDIPD